MSDVPGPVSAAGSVPHGALPLVGRRQDLESLAALLGTDDVHAGTAILRGEGGVGKSRLAEAVTREAERREFRVATGRAFPMESGVPYALFSDAFLPLLREMEPETLTVLTRGGDAELRYLFPALGGTASPEPLDPGDPREFKTRLFWNFTELLKSWAERKPLLVVLDDVQWADASSLELLHFVARQTADAPVRLLVTYNTDYRERSPGVVQAERSLTGQGLARVHELAPLSQEDVATLVEEAFSVDRVAVREFTALLYGWTRGNPFFVSEILSALVESGQLYERDGTWLGWETRELELPRSIRDAALARFRALDEDVVSVAEIVAVMESRARFPVLSVVADLPDGALLSALELLRDHGILSETDTPEGVLYDFTHPILRETLYQDLGLTRARIVHARVAEALERVHGSRVEEHADQLAYHFHEAGPHAPPGKAAGYLATAGRDALARHAGQEAARYLEAALEHLEAAGARPSDAPEAPSDAPRADLEPLSVTRDLARAQQSLGRFQEALALYGRCLEEADATGDAEGVVGLRRRLGLCCYWSGRHDDALEHYAAGLTAAEATGDSRGRARILLAQGVCLQEVGRPDEARADVEEALALAEELGDPSLLARVHRALALLFTWTGPPDRGREHGRRALELARETGEGSVAFWSHYALAALEGLTGNTAGMGEQTDAARELAARLRSPVLRLWTAELSVELAYARGEWDAALARGERAIALARSLGLRTLLPRLLVWTALIYLGRGDLERGEALVEEAWEASGAGRGPDRPVDVHVVVPAHIGRAAVLLAKGEFREAVAVGEAALEIADRTGYVFWAIHRLLPVIGEAYLYAHDVEGARRTGTRLREHVLRMEHALGLAWADACDALVRWLSGDTEEGAVLLREAADALEAIPVVPDAARVRRQLAGRLAELGNREGALAELRQVHETFVKLGAEPELEKARDMFRELDSRPPSRTLVPGMGILTGRETEIARLVAQRKSNKAVARTLSISPRTVSTHLSNIYKKLELSSRGELADLVREGRLPLE